MPRIEQAFDPEQGPYTLDDIGVLLYNIHRVLKRMQDIMEEETVMDGNTITNYFTIPAGSPVVKVDFEGSKHMNLPANVTIDSPQVKVQQIRLENLGPGTLYYSTNKYLTQLEAASNLLAGANRFYKIRKRGFKQINLVSSGGACQVRLELLT